MPSTIWIQLVRDLFHPQYVWLMDFGLVDSQIWSRLSKGLTGLDHTSTYECDHMYPKSSPPECNVKTSCSKQCVKTCQSVSKLVSKRAREIVRWLQSKWGEIVWFVSQLCDGKSIMWWMTWKFLFKTIKMMAFKERVWGYGINHAGLLTAPNCHCCLHMSFTLILDELQNVKWPTLGTELYKLTVLSLWRVITQQVVVAL